MRKWCRRRSEDAPKQGEVTLPLRILLLTLGLALLDFRLWPDNDDRYGRVRDAVARDRTHAGRAKGCTPQGELASVTPGADDERVRTVESDKAHLK